MSFLVDVNILCRIACPGDPQHGAAKASVRSLLQMGQPLFITPQVVREFWVVATRPRQANGLGMTTAEVAASIDAMEEFCTLLADSPAIHDHWKRLVVEFGASGKAAHDANHVAAMLAHGIRHVLTFDVEDFRRYEPRIQVRKPDESPV